MHYAVMHLHSTGTGCTKSTVLYLYQNSQPKKGAAPQIVREKEVVQSKIGGQEMAVII